MPRAVAHTVDSLVHPTGQHALWTEICELRAELAAAGLVIDRLTRERDEARLDLDDARRQRHEDVLRGLPP